MTEVIARIVEEFQQKFQQKPLLVRAPGRVNLIGEHTDYNNGFVLPAAINKAIYLAVSTRTDKKIHLQAIDLKEEYTCSVEGITHEGPHWAHYILGVVVELLQCGKEIGGFNCVFSGDIPLGAGLSSSAALECGVAYALNNLYSLNIEKIELVKIAQKAENKFVGVKCGIMDQFASMMGKKNEVIKLDCQTLEYEYNPLKMDGVKIVLFDSNVKHSLASSEYNTRRAQCEAGVALLQAKYPQVKSLRDATIEMLEEVVLPQDALIYQRCKYVVEEDDRLKAGCEDLKSNDVAAFGKKMFATHQGLSVDYEVSCKELDFLIDCVKDNQAVLGARMMGGGFGGCTINLVKETAVDDLVQQVTEKYKTQMDKSLKVYIAEIEEGVSIIDN